MNRFTITVRSAAAPAPLLAFLRREFPDVPLGEHRRRVLTGEPVYCSDQEETRYIDLTRLAFLLRRFDEAGVEVILSKETLRDGQWEPLPPEEQNQLRAALGGRFPRVLWGPDNSKSENEGENQQDVIKEETILVVLDPGKLENPDLDLRYAVPARIVAVTEGAVRDGGYDYIAGPPDRPGPLLALFLRTAESAGQWPEVLALLRRERFLNNDLSLAAEIYVSTRPRAGLEDCVKVYPA